MLKDRELDLASESSNLHLLILRQRQRQREESSHGKAWFAVVRKWNCIDLKSQLTGLVSATNCCSKHSCHAAEHACVYVHVNVQ